MSAVDSRTDARGRQQPAHKQSAPQPQPGESPQEAPAGSTETREEESPGEESPASEQSADEDGAAGSPAPENKPQVVQERLGHSTMAMTMDTYGDLFRAAMTVPNSPPPNARC